MHSGLEHIAPPGSSCYAASRFEMASELICDTCGLAVPADTTVCPRDGTVVLSSFDVPPREEPNVVVQASEPPRPRPCRGTRSSA